MTMIDLNQKCILIKQLKSAYRKYKTQIYYDPHSAIQRRKLAEFENKTFLNLSNEESSFFDKKRINKFFDELAEKVLKNDLDDYLTDINVITLPKKMKSSDNDENDLKFISNHEETSTQIEQCHYFIDLPVEAQILGVLWILRYGYVLDSRLYPSCYGNRLNKHMLKKLKEADANCDWDWSNNFTPFLFEPYYKFYEKWRDNALDSVKNLLDNEKHAIMISLDLKNYYYSSQIDFDLMQKDIIHGKKIIRENCNDEDKEIIKEYEDINVTLHDFIKNVFYKYYSKFEIKYNENQNTSEEKDDKKEFPFIPLGFLPSMIIANWNLQSFDQSILEDTHPSYYGRYVDDMLIVLDSHEKSEVYGQQHLKNLKDYEIVKKYFTENEDKNEDEKYNWYPLNKIFYFDESENNDESKDEYDKNPIQIHNIKHRIHNIDNHYENLQIQRNKVKFYSFSYKNSTSIIDNFKNEIRKNSSEFRLMKDSNKLFNEFEDKLFEIDYAESINKLSNINSVKINKYEISKLMTGVLNSTAFSTETVEKKIIDKVVEAFNFNLFEFFMLWEKILSLLYFNGNDNEFKEFVENIIDKIDELEFDPSKIKYHLKNKTDEDDVKKYLKDYLFSTIVRVLSLKSSKIYSKLTIFSDKSNKTKKDSELKYLNESFNFIASSMINNGFMKYPLQNTFKIEKNIQSKIKGNTDELNYNLIKNNESSPNELIFKGFCYPRYIKLHELILNQLYNTLYFKPYKNNFDEELTYLIRLHSKLNFYEYKTKHEIQSNIFENIKYHCDLKCRNHEDCPVDETFRTMKIGKRDKTKLKVGLVNTKLDMNDFEKRLIGKPNLELERFNKIKRLINDAIKNEVDLLVMPEMYIPFEWMGDIINTSKTHQMAMIFGSEPIVSGETAYNYIMASLPFSIDDNYFESVVSCRLKNHYSPLELQIMKSHHLKQPSEQRRYCMYSWKGINIAPYYCYELADVQSRSKFKSCCDIVTVSEFNKDEIYFGNIAESLSRDLYCYCIKSNTSEYGGNSIIQPSPSESRKLVELKGGENDYLVVQELDIDRLRKNAIKSDLIPNNKDKTLKPNPPRINKNIIKEKMGLKNKYSDKYYLTPYDTLPEYHVETETIDFILKEFGDELPMKKIAIWGLSLNPITSYVKYAPSRNIIKKLIELKTSVKAYDPNDTCFKKDDKIKSIEFCKSKYEVLKEADLLIILTGLDEFKQYDLHEMGKLMNNKLIFDCRNIIKKQVDLKGFKLEKIYVNRNNI